jgi:hypothetical protein
MTRKDYVKIAEVIRNRTNLNDREYLAKEFALMLREDNPRFDRDKFMKACIGK